MFPTRQEVMENRLRKTIPKNRVYISQDQRCSCLKCWGVARNMDGEGYCLECGFNWWVEHGSIHYIEGINSSSKTHRFGLLLVLKDIEE